jgi:hypothetical protein
LSGQSPTFERFWAWRPRTRANPRRQPRQNTEPTNRRASIPARTASRALCSSMPKARGARTASRYQRGDTCASYARAKWEKMSPPQIHRRLRFRCRPAHRTQHRPLTFLAQWMCALSASLHNCSTVIASRLARNGSPAFLTCGSMTLPNNLDCEPISVGSAVLRASAVLTISPAEI